MENFANENFNYIKNFTRMMKCKCVILIILVMKIILKKVY